MGFALDSSVLHVGSALDSHEIRVRFAHDAREIGDRFRDLSPPVPCFSRISRQNAPHDRVRTRKGAHPRNDVDIAAPHNRHAKTAYRPRSSLLGSAADAEDASSYAAQPRDNWTLAVAVIECGMTLRHSPFAGTSTLETAHALLADATLIDRRAACLPFVPPR